MRVLLTTSAYPPDGGGPAGWSRQMATGLRARGHQVQVITGGTDPGLVCEQDEGVEVVRVPCRVAGASPAPVRWRALKAGLAWCSVACVAGFVPEIAALRLFTRRPVVAKVFGDEVWELAMRRQWTSAWIDSFQTNTPRRALPVRWLRKAWLRSANRVVVSCEYLRGMALNWGVAMERLHVVPHTIETTATTLPPVSVPVSGALTLVTTCRLERWKGVDGLIRQVAAQPDLALVVIGDGPERHRLERTAQELGVAGRVHFTGQAGPEFVRAYLRHGDIFVLNSEAEGSPHAILEAIAAGLPVIAANAGGNPELIEDHVSGLLVPPRDFKALQAAIMELRDKNLRARLAGMATNVLADRPLADSVGRLAEILIAAQRGR